ncbi:MAG: hypothetical protein MJB14_13085, partial [Spirochaetes bacterium]|nr:hypothetical protein [Spirochaetota bacterium]
MSELVLKDLTDDEIIGLYELFFGSILIKKKKQHYISNIISSLKKKENIHKVLERLNSTEQEILKILKDYWMFPYPFISEKISIIMDEQISNITKHLNNLIAKNYIFLREEKYIIVPQIYFPDEIDSIKYKSIDNPKEEYCSQVLTHYNNLVSFFITKDLGYSKSDTLYKKDYEIVKNLFYQYTEFSKNHFNLAAFFFVNTFLTDKNIDQNSLAEYFKKESWDQICFFIKKTMPAFYQILLIFYQQQKSVVIRIDDFKRLWINSLLLSPVVSTPYRQSFEEGLDVLEKAHLLKKSGNTIEILLYQRSKTNKHEIQKIAN